MMRGSLFSAVLTPGAAVQAFAQANLIERAVTAAPGRDRRVGVYTSIRADCTSGRCRRSDSPVRRRMVQVTVKRAMLKATNVKPCLTIDVPAFAAYYRAARDFADADDFLLEVTFNGGRKEVQHFKVSVSDAAGKVSSES
jgi:hypothetical protein